jgi:hypothetical protein
MCATTIRRKARERRPTKQHTRTREIHSISTSVLSGAVWGAGNASKIIHELTHTTQKPAATDQQVDQEEAEAQEGEIECGFRLQLLPQVITVTP